MATNSDDSTGGLSSTAFIAIVSSVGGVVVLIATIMTCTLGCLCFREYWKRRADSLKNSDREGLLRSRGEEEEVVSDEGETADSSILMTNMQSGSEEGKCPAPNKKSTFMSAVSSNKVAPAQDQAGVQPSGSRAHKRRTNSSKSSSPHTQQSLPGTSAALEQERRVTMIGDSEDELEEEEESMVTAEDDGLDSQGDQVQLVRAERKSRNTSHKAPRRMTLESKAELLGRPVAYVKELSKSSPLDAPAMTSLVSKPSGPLFSQYKSVPSNSAELPHLTLAENAKNRYRNVLPNPHSAVNLRYAGVEGSTYINANFVRGLHGEEKAYIAAQGPISDTMADFWRMIWEKEVNIVVMLTNLIENGRHKCVKYWPPVPTAGDSDTVVHGKIEVTRSREETVPSNYTLSYLNIKNLETGEERDIYHFWYIAWPDFGIPKDTEPILKLRSVVASLRDNLPPGPMVVHCSAGLGRSGTFIAIDMGIQQFEETGVVDPLKYLCEMRQDRGGMVQTEDQYIFIHHALAAYMK